MYLMIKWWIIKRSRLNFYNWWNICCFIFPTKSVSIALWVLISLHLSTKFLITHRMVCLNTLFLSFFSFCCRQYRSPCYTTESKGIHCIILARGSKDIERPSLGLHSHRPTDRCKTIGPHFSKGAYKYNSSTEKFVYLRIYRPGKYRLVINPFRTRFKRSVNNDLAFVITSIWKKRYRCIDEIFVLLTLDCIGIV